ncbi:cytochrome P450, partial [Klebsiella pneumoniae]
CPQENAPKNLLYGAGIHVCPGAPLARMELNVFMEELLKQVNMIDMVEGQPPERAAFPTGGFNHLPLVCH